MGDGMGVGSDGISSMGPVNRSLDDSGTDGTSLGLLHSQLPQSEVELDNLTEFNTAHNRRIAGIVDVSTNSSLGLGERRKRKLHSVHFSDADEVINPEDVDPSVGRFRNLVQETFIPNKVIISHWFLSYDTLIVDIVNIRVLLPKPVFVKLMTQFIDYHVHLSVLDCSLR